MGGHFQPTNEPVRYILKCEVCQEDMPAHRPTRRFCSQKCYTRKKNGWPKIRSCRHCGVEIRVETRADANRQHCSKECAKNHSAKRIRTWQQGHPETPAKYRAARVAKNPTEGQANKKLERKTILELLGGECVVCGVNKPVWLHVDFISGSRGLKYRHPRHLAYVRNHLEEFRLLCANHHYELTLTGRIDGTAIVQ